MTGPATSLLELTEVRVRIQGSAVLQEVSLAVEVGEVAAILGRNGAGKTSTLRTIIGLLAPEHGTVRFDDRDITGRQAHEIAAFGIGYVPEHRAIFGTLTVEENLRIAERRSGQLDARREFIYELFPDLSRQQAMHGRQLSGGQQQMLAIARALVADNRLLLVDEPSEGLAPILVEQLVSAFPQIASEATVLLVEQNFAFASEVADRYCIIAEGRSVKAGVMAELREDDATVATYLGAA